MAEIILLIVIAGLVLGGIFSLGVLVVLLCLTVGHVIRVISYFEALLKAKTHER